VIVSPLMRRLAALAILVALAWLGWSVIAEPVLDGMSRDSATIAHARRSLADYDQLGAELPGLEQRLGRIRAGGADTAGFIDGTANPAIVAAKLQGDVQRIAAAAAVALRSSQTLPPVKEGSFRRIGLQLDLGATPAALQRLLYQIETATPYLFIQKLSIHLPEDGTAPAAPDGQPQLTIRLEVCGYQREGGA
jgi:general secretion pathway protein M